LSDYLYGFEAHLNGRHDEPKLGRKFVTCRAGKRKQRGPLAVRNKSLRAAANDPR
jgi:hypothetical protein